MSKTTVDVELHVTFNGEALTLITAIRLPMTLTETDTVQAAIRRIYEEDEHGDPVNVR